MVVKSGVILGVIFAIKLNAESLILEVLISKPVVHILGSNGNLPASDSTMEAVSYL